MSAAHAPEEGHLVGGEAEEEAAQHESLSPEQFKLAFRNHAAGVALITADAGGGPVAMTATSVFSVSAEPPLIVFSVSDASSSSEVMRHAETVVIHILGGEQLHLAKLGATSGIDRFADTDLWRRLPTGEALFHQAPVWIRATIVERMRAGTSTVFAVHATESNVQAGDELPADPLVYHNRTWHRLSELSEIPPVFP